MYVSVWLFCGALTIPSVATAQVRIDLGGEVACTLRSDPGGVIAVCGGATFTCAEVLRADLSPGVGDEVVSRCSDADGGNLFVAVSSAGSVVWARRAGVHPETGDSLEGDCSLPPDVRIEAVDVVDDETRELLVRVTSCIEPGAFGDWDVVWKWRQDRMEPVTRSSLQCNYTGETSGEGPPTPNAGYRCEGGYVDIVGAGPARTLSIIRFPDRELRGRRGPDGRIISRRGWPRQSLRWDPEAFRLVPVPAPAAGPARRRRH